MVDATNPSGHPGHRKALGTVSEIDSEVEGIRGTMPMPIFQIAVVVDFIDKRAFNKDDIAAIEEDSKTQGLARRAPHGSIIGRITTRSGALYDSTPEIFLPAMLFDADPVKPGEQVFVFYVDPMHDTHIGYWWRRVPQPLDTDDINFCHGDRKYEYHEDLSPFDKFDGKEQPKPRFDNGGSIIDDDQRTLSGINDFKDILNNAKSNKQIVKEPVARFRKRPGDKCILGSNSTRIVLGTDRPGITAESDPSFTDEDTGLAIPRRDSGTIDMVSGYGFSGTPTAPVIIENDRGELEVNKTPTKNNEEDNPIEGEVDFENDKSRIYISADTNADAHFSISFPADDGTGSGPAVVIKSDQVRLIARSDIKISVGENGAGIIIRGNDIILLPSPDGVIKLGGEDADKALLVNTGINAGGTVVGIPILSTMGGASGLGNPVQGSFATKVLVK